ncbi:Sec-independent protein translocase protein TatB [Sorangium sp. So ce542]|uniref:Sec-independent protein translocase protein TatB n=1 Tax=Sorangium sp. So ce542 TaxID=3133316 RepID=UPI003F63AE5F
MFGFSFGEVMVLVIVGIIVVGPRRLPAMMRSAGSWIAKLRRMTTELRTQSGIDDLIRQEGLERELRELRALSRVNVIETLVKPVIDAGTVGTVVSATPRVRPPEPEPLPPPPDVPPAPPQNVPPLREREYPVLGCDAYGAEIEEAPKPADAAEGGAAAAAASGAEDAAGASGAAGAEDAAAPQGAASTAGVVAAQETAAAQETGATGNGAAS